MQGEYLATVEEVRSGDDLMLMVDLGLDDLYKRVRVRLRGVDTPDAYKAGPETDAGKIREEVRKLTRNKCRIVVSGKNRSGWIVDLHYTPHEGQANGCLNDMLIARGYIYKGPPEDKGTSFIRITQLSSPPASQQLELELGET